MAITLIGGPPKFSINEQYIEVSTMPVYNSIVYTVNSTNINECNFRYVATIYVNGVNVKTLKLFPNELGNADFKINRVLEDYVNNEVIGNIYEFKAIENRLIEYYIVFGEEYDTSDNCDSIPTLFDDLLTTDVSYAWNASLQYQEFIQYQENPTIYNFDSLEPDTHKFLTHQPERILIGKNDQAELSYITYIGNDYNAGSFVVETYDRNGNMILQDTLTNTLLNISSYTEMFQSVPSGPQNINARFGYDLISDDTHYYRVYMRNVDSLNLLKNPTLQYLSGDNYWTTKSLPSCGTSFGITPSNNMTLVIPDASCGVSLKIEYDEEILTPGKQYSISITIASINNPSGNDEYVALKLGTNSSTYFEGTGTFTDEVTCGNSKKIEIVAFMDADTSFGSHSITITNIEIKELGGFRTSEYKYYEIDNRPSRINPIRFRWLNLLGGQDTYSFTIANVRKTDIKRTSYTKLMGSFITCETSFDGFQYKIGERGKTYTSITANDIITATSNWLTVSEANWMEELFTSPNTYIIENMFTQCAVIVDDNNINQLPINITSNSFEEKSKYRTKNINHSIEFEYAFDKNIQRN